MNEQTMKLAMPEQSDNLIATRLRLQHRRRRTNAIALTLSLAAMAFGLLWLIWILWTTLRLGIGGLSIELFTQATPPANTDGGGLCSNHPGNRGGMTKIIEAVRQLRGEAHPAVQVPNCDLAIAHGTGGSLGTRHVGSTVILERE